LSIYYSQRTLHSSPSISLSTVDHPPFPMYVCHLSSCSSVNLVHIATHFRLRHPDR